MKMNMRAMRLCFGIATAVGAFWASADPVDYWFVGTNSTGVVNSLAASGVFRLESSGPDVAVD